MTPIQNGHAADGGSSAVPPPQIPLPSTDPASAAIAPNVKERPSPATAIRVDAVIGQVVWLMMNSPGFRHVFLTDLEWMVMPPILLNQYRMLHIENRTVTFAAWGYLSEAAEARLQSPSPRLAPADWKSGDRLWLIHLFAPFGHTEMALVELERTNFAGKAFNMHRVTPDGSRVVEQRQGTPEPKRDRFCPEGHQKVPRKEGAAE